MSGELKSMRHDQLSRYLLICCLSFSGWVACAGSTACAQSEWADLRAEALNAMQHATNYFSQQVASHGGYVYHYDLQLKQRWGEGVATADQIWVQPPGTPSVGLAWIAAYDATGDVAYLEPIKQTAEALLYGQLRSGGGRTALTLTQWASV